jgi:hypothetical protein
MGQRFSQLDIAEDGTFNMLLDFFNCRTYMSDCLYDLKTGNEISIQKNRYTDLKFDYLTGKTYIGIEFVDTDQLNIFMSNLQYLYDKEDIAEVSRSIVHTTKYPQTIVVEGDGNWKNCCWKIQLYTYYLRSLCYTNPKEFDKGYLSKYINHKDNEIKLLDKVTNPFESFASINPDYSSVHRYTGPVSFSKDIVNITMREYIGIEWYGQ